ncbi:MAG: glycosyl hydrolase family 18 protein [Clostridia bacterium]|nr:glycosyl hydrolase family 18 protein [Clostridia bacterium]
MKKVVFKLFSIVLCFFVLALSLPIDSAALVSNSSRAGEKPGAIIADHNSVDISKVPSDIFLKARSRSIFFGHASHGEQLVYGAASLNETGLKGNDKDIFNAKQYYYLPYVVDNANKSDRKELLMYFGVGAIPGKYVEIGPWADKIRAGLAKKDSKGRPVFDTAMFTGCYDFFSSSERVIKAYLDTMNKLEEEFPDIKFIYMTGNNDGQGISGVSNRNNDLIRDYCTKNNKILFDFADIESHDPDGNSYLEKKVNENGTYYSSPDASYPGDKNWMDDWGKAHRDSLLLHKASTSYCSHTKPLSANMKGRALWWILSRISAGEWDTTQPISVTVSPTTVSLKAGESKQFTALVTNSTGTAVTWSVQEGASGGIVSSSGMYTAPRTPGVYHVIAKSCTDPAKSATATVTVTSIDPVTPSGANWVNGYYVAYQNDLLPPEKIDWSGLTHITMGRIKANSNGTLDHNFDIGAPAGPSLARKIAELAHQNKVKAILMLGGDDNGTSIRGAVRNHRALFISNLVKAMNDYGYDGIDLDWENDLDWDLFITFAKELRAAAPGKIITMPCGAINMNYQQVEPKIVEIAKYVDQLNIMSYYPCTAWAGSGWYSWHTSPLKGAKPNTPVSIEDSLNRYAKAGIPKKKLGMGIGFYAIGYKGGITAPNQPTDGLGDIIAGGDNHYSLSRLFGDGGAYSEKYRKWDSAAMCSYLSIPEPEEPDSFGSRYISFEDEQSIIEKGKFCRENGYGGTIIWTINQGYVKTHSNPNFLMQALRKGFIDPDFSQAVAVSASPQNVWVKPGKTVQFKSFVTGTANKAVTWSIKETNGGSIDRNGLYTAPSSIVNGQTKIHVVVTSNADPTKSASVNVVVTNDTGWDPGLSLHNCAEWWKEVSANDLKTESVYIEYKGAKTKMWEHGTVYPNKPNFAVTVQVKDGEKIRLYAYSSDGRTAKTEEITFISGSGPFSCPIEGPID